MKFKKPNFWDYKKPNFIAYLLLPFVYLISLINFFSKKEKIITDKIKTICVGNIYVGGTGKTPISIKINKILKNLNIKTAFIKKKYADQFDEQAILSSHGKLFCEKERLDALKKAIDEKIDVAILDDGLQDNQIICNTTFVCFNIKSWIGNGFLIPSGPLREKIQSLTKHDGVFLKSSIRDFNSSEKL